MPSLRSNEMGKQIKMNIEDLQIANSYLVLIWDDKKYRDNKQNRVNYILSMFNSSYPRFEMKHYLTNVINKEFTFTDCDGNVQQDEGIERLYLTLKTTNLIDSAKSLINKLKD